MKNLVIIKIGGSVITNKSSDKPVFRKSICLRLFEEIAMVKKKNNFDLILVHGAGSFGHPLAKKYRLNEGFVNSKTSRGISLTKQSMLKLNNLVLNELIVTGLDACIVETSAVATTTNRRINTFNLESVSNLINKKIIPVLYGDVVIDTKKGISILSGDQTAVYLARKLGAKKVIFVSDVKGIYDRNPKEFTDARLIREVNASNLRSILSAMRNHNKNDVTGEMKGKILAAKQDLAGISTIIISGLIPNSLRGALLDRVNGTRILL